MRSHKQTNKQTSCCCCTVFTVTPERAQLVQFIQPYYYSAGAALYAPGGSIQGVQSWGDLRGKSLTIKRGALLGQ